MNERRRFVLAFAASTLGVASASFAQQRQRKIARIGYLGATTAPESKAQIEALAQGLHDLGYVEGQNIVTEYRFVEGQLRTAPAVGSAICTVKNRRDCSGRAARDSDSATSDQVRPHSDGSVR